MSWGDSKYLDNDAVHHHAEQLTSGLGFLSRPGQTGDVLTESHSHHQGAFFFFGQASWLVGS